MVPVSCHGPGGQLSRHEPGERISRRTENIRRAHSAFRNTWRRRAANAYRSRAGRGLLLVSGLFLVALGVALSVRAGLGISPVSSVPYVLSLQTSLTVGTATVAMHSTFILLQVLLLRRDYQPVQLLQLPVALLFGGLTDISLWLVREAACSFYWQRLLLTLAGSLLIGVGTSLEIAARVMTMAAEGLILAVCRKTRTDFGDVKVIFDIGLVALACVLSLAFGAGIQGVREGTLLSAVLVGVTAKKSGRLLERCFG